MLIRDKEVKKTVRELIEKYGGKLESTKKRSFLVFNNGRKLPIPSATSEQHALRNLCSLAAKIATAK